VNETDLAAAAPRISEKVQSVAPHAVTAAGASLDQGFDHHLGYGTAHPELLI
jgi:hypothetical protein